MEWIDKLNRLWKCKIRHRHDFEVTITFPDNSQKLTCKRCGRNYGIHHGVKTILPWDMELEVQYRIIYPDSF